MKFGRGVLDEFQAAWTMHGPRAGYGGGSGGGSRGKNTEISALEGGPDPPGPPIVGNPALTHIHTHTHRFTYRVSNYGRARGSGPPSKAENSVFFPLDPPPDPPP